MDYFKQPWINYFDSFFQSSLILEYPKNMIFTAQILTHHLKNNIYDTFPYAEKFDLSSLNTIDWKNTVVTISKDLVIAPEPLKQLINLEKRLNYEKAKDFLFHSFQLPIINSFYIVVLVIFAFSFLYLFRQYNLLGQFRYL